MSGDETDLNYVPLFRKGSGVSDGRGTSAQGHSGRYIIHEYLGKGGFAECYSAFHELDRSFVALKVIDRRRLRDNVETKILREFRLHKECRHRNIVQLYAGFQDKTFYFLAMELCNRDSLLALINYYHAKERLFPENYGARFTYDVLSATDYLLNAGILHRDIKPGNIFISKRGDAKLGDFGLAVKVRDLNPSSCSGTPNYLAPEVLDKKGHSEFSEVWSIGCLVYCMMIGRPPFETSTIEDTYQRIRRCDYSFPSLPKISDSVKMLIERCLVLDRYSRPSVTSLMELNWFRRVRPVKAATQNAALEDQMSALTLASGNLFRAKSVGDMLQPAHRQISDNSHYGYLPMRACRPKSAMTSEYIPMIDDDREEKTYRMGSRDSGFGSESDVTRRPILTEKVQRILGLIKTVSECDIPMILDRALPELYVIKWVDYTNRRGFACVLSDGTLCVKFNEGVSITWPRYSDTLLYSLTAFSSPRVVRHNDESLTMIEKEHILTARDYRAYMERELANSSPYQPCQRHLTDLPMIAYATYQRVPQSALILVLTDGTIQVNLMDKKVKIILNIDEQSDNHISVAVLCNRRPPMAFTTNYDRYQVDFRAPPEVYDYLTEVHETVMNVSDLFHSPAPPLPRRRVQITTC